MEGIIGKNFRKGKETVPLEYVMGASEFVGIYFGAHWAPPCRLFTPLLAEFYNTVNSPNRKFEVIFCSNDGNEAAFDRNYAEMPWCAVPYTDELRIQNLKQKFGISGIPTLVVLDKNGDVISHEGRADVQNSQAAAFEIWQKKKEALNQ